jgi:hypothetical protein
MPYDVELGRIAELKRSRLPEELAARWPTHIKPILGHNPRPRATDGFCILDTWNAYERHVYSLLCDAWPDLQVHFTIEPDDVRPAAGARTVREGAVYVYDITPRPGQPRRSAQQPGVEGERPIFPRVAEFE